MLGLEGFGIMSDRPYIVMSPSGSAGIPRSMTEDILYTILLREAVKQI